MKRAALLYNPVSGSHGARNRAALLERAVAVLRGGGVQAELVATHGRGTASTQAMELIAAGFDTILACGGDGTVHETMQQMVEQRSPAALGVIPLGTGNALATDLRMPRHPERAAEALLHFVPRRIAVGRMETPGTPHARYFIVTSGVGADAHMLYHLNFEIKRKYGMLAYYAQGIANLLKHDFPPFLVEFRDGDRQRTELVSQLLGVRIRFFPGLVRELAPGASLERDDLRLVLFKTPRRLAYLNFMTGRLYGGQRMPKEIELIHAGEVVCRPVEAGTPVTPKWRDEVRTERIYAEADGEPMGRIPVRITAVPDALNLLMPCR
jgi:diacylglycerol kinase (ATP)